MFYPLILAHGGSAQSVKTASIVLQSLTPNAQSVFKVLAEYQLSHPDEEGKSYIYFQHVSFFLLLLLFLYIKVSLHYSFTGMPINNLYTICRERFLVSSQVTLNSHLTEFKDHELVKTRRHSDGQDCLYIPLTRDALEKVVQEISQ